MIALKINSLKSFMENLLMGSKFDSFLVSEVSLTTYNTFTIDGHIQKAFYTTEEYEQLPQKEFSLWHTLKPLCYSLMKGTKLPNRFKIILLLSENAVKSFLDSRNLTFSPENVNGLFLNLKYEENSLTCTTGTSLNFFTLDKSLENAWDNFIKEFLSCYDY